MKVNGEARARKIEKATWWMLAGVITIWSIMLFLDGKSQKVFMGGLTVFVLAAAAVWQAKSRHPLPPYFISIVYVFIFLAIGLGTFGGFYSVAHFDDVLHLLSGVWTGYGGWLVMEYMVGKEISSRLPKAFIGFYVIVFALAVAGLWELLEFAGDKLFHFTAQGRDHDDTMFDMIDGLIGGITVAFFLIKKQDKKGQ